MTSQQRERLQMAGRAHSEGNLQEAERLSNSVLEEDANNLPALLMSGISAAKLEKADLALEKLRKVILHEPRALPAQVWLSLLLRPIDPYAATQHARAAVEIDANHPEAQYAYGLCLADAGDAEGARRCFERAVSASPMTGMYHFVLAVACERMGDREQALKALRRAVKYAPSLDWSYKLGLMELVAGNVSRAREIVQDLLTKHPDSAPAHHLMARVCEELDRDAEADAHLHRAIELDPTWESAHALLGKRMQSLGEFEDAIRHFLKSAELKPVQGSAYYGITTSKKISQDDTPLLEEMEQVAQRGQLDENERALLEYGLGKAYNDLKDRQRAMEHYEEANRLSKLVSFRGATFDRVAFQAEIDNSIRVFTKDFIRSAPRGSESDVPIFVVGMIRSGTTLMEHVLSCHPEVGAAGEQAYWATNDAKIVDYREGSIDEWTLKSNAHAYLHLIQEVAGDHPKITDKNPANVLTLGLIHVAFPNARIIHMIRNPVDTMLSIWMTAIRNPPPFACDKDNIVFAYKQYLRAMEHWRSVLPADRLLEVHYEDLVSNQEHETRRVLDFLGLAWNEACGIPEKSARVVKTPSLWQVRQKIHTGSMNKWKDYEPWLGPFKEFL